MPHIVYNGKFFDAAEPILAANNRALRYGDGVFETIKARDENLCFFLHHMERLFGGLSALLFDVPKLFTPRSLEDFVNRLLKKNRLPDARVRISVFRGAGGLYDTEEHGLNFIIETFNLPAQAYGLNSNGLTVCVYREARKAIDKFSNFKHNNFLPYAMAALHAKSERCNDAFVLNSAGRICDSTIANVFVVKNDRVYTPALTEGCIAGIIRDALINALRGTSFEVIETEIDEAFLFDADEIFLTNSIRNIRWVLRAGNNIYSNTVTQAIHNYIQRNNPEILF